MPGAAGVPRVMAVVSVQGGRGAWARALAHHAVLP